MPPIFHSKTAFQSRIAASFDDRTALGTAIESSPLPAVLSEWLGRLKVLKGVPFQYLVPDEAMLPAESIRFFYLDMNWVDALLDGAFSIGRNLNTNTRAASMNLDAAAIPLARPRVDRHVTTARARALGIPAPQVTLQVVSGFVLRSSVVSAYQGIGVNVFPKGHTPEDKIKNPNTEIELLPILRFEPLGTRSDTLLCLVDGDAFRVDVHEAPEQLHYGIDSYKCDSGEVTAEKTIHTFSKKDTDVKLTGETEPLPLNNSFRGNTRVLKMASLGQQIAKLNNLSRIDSAEMGFEMTEGVGVVRFERGTS